MAEYEVTLARSARKELEKLPVSVAQRIIEQLEILMKNPRPVRAIKLQGNRNLWRLRVGDYRVLYSIDDLARQVDVSAVRHRRAVYRDL